MSDIELAWAAGFLDGEGNCRCWSDGKHSYPRMQLTQKDDTEPLERFVEAVGVGKVYGPYEGRGIYRVQLTGKAARSAFTLLAPFLSSRRRRQCEAVMS